MTKEESGNAGRTGLSQFFLCDRGEGLNPFPEMFGVHFSSGTSDPVTMSGELRKTLEERFESIRSQSGADLFTEFYRHDVLGYHEKFMREYAPQIEEEMSRLFNGGYPRYMVTTGIGANELFTRFAASVNNKDCSRKVEWFVLNSPKSLLSLPNDLTPDNTIFLEFSRSGVAEETVKIHEYTPRNAKRIVFSNGGPLGEIAKRDGNLVLPLPPEISGRYGRNKTPILLAPMFVAGMDTGRHWKDIDKAIREFDITDTRSLPFAIAGFIYVHQRTKPRNLIYMGCNDEDLGLLGDQLLQFWNEGVNRTGSDIMMSRFFGLPRDSHMSIEGILGNRDEKIGLFLLRTNMRERVLPPIVSETPDVLNAGHAGLRFGDEDVIFAMANYKRFTEVLPTVLIGVPDKVTMTHAAVLGQLFADVTFIYSKLIGVDPGSNPEVASIRENSTRFLSSVAKEMREKNLSIEKAAWELTR